MHIYFTSCGLLFNIMLLVETSPLPLTWAKVRDMAWAWAFAQINSQNKDSSVVLHWFSLFYEKVKIILCSIHTFRYKGLAKNKEHIELTKKTQK